MRLNPRQIADLRAECGKGGLDAALLAAQLLEMVEKLQGQLAATEAMLDSAQGDLARVEAEIEQRLGQTTCPKCHDAQAPGARKRLRAEADAP